MRIPKKAELTIAFIVIINLVIISIAAYTLVSPGKTPSAIRNNDYREALKYAVCFFDANKCGKDVSLDNVFEWRSPCHVDDGSDLNLDLTGGFHGGFNHVKFGLTQGYTASILGWSLFLYRDLFDSTGNTKKMLSTLK